MVVRSADTFRWHSKHTLMAGAYTFTRVIRGGSRSQMHDGLGRLFAHRGDDGLALLLRRGLRNELIRRAHRLTRLHTIIRLAGNYTVLDGATA